MPSHTARVAPLILDELTRGERRVLSLIVAIGKALERNQLVKGDLSTVVQSTLRGLVASRVVRETNGVYSLAPRQSEPCATRDPRVASPKRARTPMIARSSKEDRNKAAARKNAVKVEQYLTEIEKSQGCARAWAMREKLELGHVTLEQLRGR